MKIIKVFMFLSIIINSTVARNIDSSDSLIVDETKNLSYSFKYKVNNSLKKYSIPVSIYMMNNLQGDGLEEISIKIKEALNIDTSSSNEILLIIALGDRKIYFSVGESIKEKIKEEELNRIIKIMGSFFKNGKYEKGLLVSLNILGNYLNEDFINLGFKTNKRSFKKYDFMIPIILILFFFIFLGRKTIFSKDKTSFSIDTKENDTITKKRGSGSF